MVIIYEASYEGGIGDGAVQASQDNAHFYFDIHDFNIACSWLKCNEEIMSLAVCSFIHDKNVYSHGWNEIVLLLEPRGPRLASLIVVMARAIKVLKREFSISRMALYSM